MKRYDIPSFNQLFDDSKLKHFYQKKKKKSNTPPPTPSLSNGPLVMPRELHHLFSSPLFWPRLDLQIEEMGMVLKGPLFHRFLFIPLFVGTCGGSISS